MNMSQFKVTGGAAAGSMFLRTRVRSAGRMMIQPAELIARKDRNAKKVLKRIGGYAVRTARNSLKAKKDLKVNDFPQELLLLIKATRMAIRRNARGQFLAGSGRKMEADLREAIPQWPQSVGMPGGPPRVTVRITKKGRKFAGFKNLIRADVYGAESVVFGPETKSRADIPGDLEFGGSQARPRMEWIRVFKKGKPVYLFVKVGTESARRPARPYIGPAFDRTLDALIPRVFKDLF